MKYSLIPLAAVFASFVAFDLARGADNKSSVNSADEKFIKEAAAGGQAEVKLGKLASDKAASADVKSLAQTIVSDHTAANSELEALAQKKHVELSAVIAPKSASMFQSLEKYSGNDFDKEYLKQMESDHKKDISDFESASKKAEDSDLKAFIDKTLPVLRQHLDKIKELRSK